MTQSTETNNLDSLSTNTEIPVRRAIESWISDALLEDLMSQEFNAEQELSLEIASKSTVQKSSFIFDLDQFLNQF